MHLRLYWYTLYFQFHVWLIIATVITSNSVVCSAPPVLCWTLISLWHSVPLLLPPSSFHLFCPPPPPFPLLEHAFLSQSSVVDLGITIACQSLSSRYMFGVRDQQLASLIDTTISCAPQEVPDVCMEMYNFQYDLYLEGSIPVISMETLPASCVDFHCVVNFTGGGRPIKQFNLSIGQCLPETPQAVKEEII